MNSPSSGCSKPAVAFEPLVMAVPSQMLDPNNCCPRPLFRPAVATTAGPAKKQPITHDRQSSGHHQRRHLFESPHGPEAPFSFGPSLHCTLHAG